MDVLQTLGQALQGRYRVEKFIGRGGMATVYAAHDLKHDRPVAIKVLLPDLAASIGGDRFAREIQIAARLTHPGILTVFDSGEVGGLLYYVMPLVEGESLRDRLKREKQLSIGDAIDITCEVADALSFAHDHHVVHRDIKPENILLQSGRALVADFGIARAANDSAERLTMTGVSIGTAAYMSPEQSAGRDVDPRADIYSLGCTLYEMLGGDPPFTGSNPVAVMAKHALEQVPSLRVVRPSVPEELESAVLQALEKVPADRFQTMEEFKAAILGDVPRRSTRTSPVRTSRYSTSYRIRESRFWSVRRAAVAGGIAALLLVGLAVRLARNTFNTRPAPLADANRVAVLYFDDLSGGALRYLADGLTESLIDRLSSVAALDVVSANGVRPFRGHDVAADSLRRALQVGTVVRGTVALTGSKVRLTVQLVDAASNADVAHKSIEVDTAHVVALRTEAATQAAAFLREQVGNEVRLREDRIGTTNDRAWLLVQRAEKLKKDADSLAGVAATNAARVTLKQADSVLAIAESLDREWIRIPVRRATVANARARLSGRERVVGRTLVDSGVAYADNALRVQPNSADALEAKGNLLYTRYLLGADVDPKVRDRALDEAESTLTRAVEQNKNQAVAWATLSELNYSKLNIQNANAAAVNAYHADAYLASAQRILQRLFWTSHDLELFPEALKWCNEGHRRFSADPFFTLCRLWMYTTKYELPNVDSAWTYKAKYLQLVDEPRRGYDARLADVLIAGALARAALADSARRVLLRARATPAEDPTRELEGYEAVMRVILGDRDEAVRLIADYLTVNPEHRKGFATRTGWWWRDLQANARFNALIAGAR